ncbi:hypothetical protein NQT62_00610 [Limnobacter humi]|uniref:HPt domain-containing protein n=1 Tax=Limnobacter humi TaxID=1778671 RepID=A0ABT1WEU3_9BURK|nr:hypothetical protein [Limnobacter humi]MCQ8894939.1 hypothetical protein [Limnobacter humi]
MAEHQYNEANLDLQDLIDLDQWGRLSRELGLDTLLEFATEFFEETREQWVDQQVDPHSMPEKAFQSLAHRSAGAAGTIGFMRLRFVFLCMEHNPIGDPTQRYMQHMRMVLEDTERWVASQH